MTEENVKIELELEKDNYEKLSKFCQITNVNLQDLMNRVLFKELGYIKEKIKSEGYLELFENIICTKTFKQKLTNLFATKD